MAKFERGHAKVGGRVAGTPNRATAAANAWVSRFWIESGRREQVYEALLTCGQPAVIAQVARQLDGCAGVGPIERSEVTGPGGGPISFRFVEARPS